MSIVRRMMMRSKRAKINLLQDPTSPHGWQTNFSNYWIGSWYLLDTIQNGEKLRLHIRFKVLEPLKTDLILQNSTNASAGRIDWLRNVVKEDMTVDIEWVVYGANNFLRVGLWPNANTYIQSEVELIELYRI